MRSVARLLLGPEGDRLLDLLAPDSDERRMTARVREAGEWCQSTPGAGSLRVQRRGWHGQPIADMRRGHG
jgi:hypothetical protein